MRPGQHQQNRRGRSRNNSGSGNSSSNGNNSARNKGQNPLSRSFESNGPDVKVRGTPAHIAEKYLTLARDAQSSGDRVLAENYLQHAEHYSRIIMAYREQFQTPGEAQVQVPRRMSGTDGFDLTDEMGDEDGGDEVAEDFGGGPQPGNAAAAGGAPGGQDNPGNGPLPQRIAPQQRQDGRPYEGRQDGRYERNGNQDRNNDGQQRGDRPFRRDGQQPQNQQNRFRDRNDRNDRNFRQNGNGNGGGQGDRDRGYEPRFDRGERQDNRQDGNRADQRPEQRSDNRGDFRQDRGPRPERSDRHDRGDRPERPHQPFEAAPVVNAPAAEAPAFMPSPLPVPPPMAAAAVAAPAPVPAAATPTPRKRERLVDQPAHEQPEFLRRPVRRTKAAAAAASAETSDAAPKAGSGEDPSSAS